MEEVRDMLARCGLAYIYGPPPPTEKGMLLIYTGGCDAEPAIRRNGRWVRWTGRGDGKEIDREIMCWMRMPHPSFWPMMDAPADMVPERDLYGHADDLFQRAAAEKSPS